NGARMLRERCDLPARGLGLGQSEEDTADSQEPVPRSASMATTEIKQKILIVDDEPSIVDAVATALRYEGYDVEEAGTGRAALTAVMTFEPDLVVLDWMLPDIEGIE